MSVTDEIRAIVKELMYERRITQTQLAEKLGVTPQALSRTLNERGKVPGLWKALGTAIREGDSICKDKKQYKARGPTTRRALLVRSDIYHYAPN